MLDLSTDPVFRRTFERRFGWVVHRPATAAVRVDLIAVIFIGWAPIGFVGSSMGS